MNDEKTNHLFIRILDVTKKFGDFVAVDAVSLDIRQGELFSILGGSGCGKTTLLRMLAGFEKPTSGRIEIDGVDVGRRHRGPDDKAVATTIAADRKFTPTCRMRFECTTETSSPILSSAASTEKV